MEQQRQGVEQKVGLWREAHPTQNNLNPGVRKSNQPVCLADVRFPYQVLTRSRSFCGVDGTRSVWPLRRPRPGWGLRLPASAIVPGRSTCSRRPMGRRAQRSSHPGRSRTGRWMWCGPSGGTGCREKRNARPSASHSTWTRSGKVDFACGGSLRTVATASPEQPAQGGDVLAIGEGLVALQVDHGVVRRIGSRLNQVAWPGPCLDGCSPVRTAVPARRTAAAMSGWSVATSTSSMSGCVCAARHAWTTMGVPPMSARGFPGNRVESIRAGMMAVILTGVNV